jgi:rhodanese-related sulfurtransferase
MENQKKENRALLIGVILIFVVLAIFFFRSNLADKKTAQISQDKSGESFNLTTISSQELSKKISSKENIQLVDIRSMEEYQTDHIIDSVSLPFTQEVEFSTARIKKDASVVIINNNGDEEITLAAFKKIKGDGYQNVSALDGGIISWKSQNFSTVTWGDPQSFVNQSKVIYVDADTLKKQLDAGANIFILDIQEKNTYAESHLAHAVNIPLAELEQKRIEIPINKKIIVYGATELQGFQGGVRLYDLGIANNAILKGGLNGWKDKGFPIEK